jgi:hypothetical protein
MKHLAVAAFVLLGAMLVATQPAMAQTTPAKTAITIPVTGSGGGSTFAGTFQLQQFATSQGQVFANGLLSGIVTAANGTKTSVLQTVSMPVQVGTSTCQILHLDLGPLNLTCLDFRSA